MNEVQLFPWWLTLTLALWATVGPLLGVGVGHYLVRSVKRSGG